MMNAPETPGGQLPTLYGENETGTAALVLDGSSMDRMMDAAKMMASAKVTVPQHFRNSPGDCMAVVIQAMQWKMNPFAVAQKTHLTQGGQLGYEAQLISAVVTSCGAIVGSPHYEFIGDWSKILGKVVEKEGKSGGKYYAAAYTMKDEEGLGVICRATLRGESEPREITVMMSQCYPRFSTQWATDPQQQITYVAIRKWSRRYAPGAILGVYTPEELEEAPPAGEREINPTKEDKKKKTPTLAPWPDDAFKAKLTKWRETGTTRPDEFIAILLSRGTLTDAQKAEINKGRVIEGTAKTTESGPGLTFAQVEERLRKAEDAVLLDVAADFIREIPDAQQRAELQAIYESVKAELAAGA